MTVNRRQLLRGHIRPGYEAVRPPWALPESRFVEVCSRCDECVSVCPEGVLLRGSGGFPEIRFEQSGCNFCGKCVAVCVDRALLNEQASSPWRLLANVADTCISLHGVTCRACGDFCDAGAILFKIESRAVSRPIINASICTGCGYCVKPCPVDAIQIEDSMEEA